MGRRLPPPGAPSRRGGRAISSAPLEGSGRRDASAVQAGRGTPLKGRAGRPGPASPVLALATVPRGTWRRSATARLWSAAVGLWALVTLVGLDEEIVEL